MRCGYLSLSKGVGQAIVAESGKKIYLGTVSGAGGISLPRQAHSLPAAYGSDLGRLAPRLSAIAAVSVEGKVDNNTALGYKE